MNSTRVEPTKNKLLLAAEQLFAERGFNAVSIRDITHASGSNIAAVNYHFSSKEGLIQSIVKKYFLLVFTKRMAYLDQGIATHQDAPIPLYEIITAFIKPIAEIIETDDHTKKLFCRIMSWMMQTNVKCAEHAGIEPELQEMVERFTTELRRTLPSLSFEQSYCCIHYVFSTITMTLMHSEGVSIISRGKVTYGSVSDHLEEIITFCTSGVQGIASQTQ